MYILGIDASHPEISKLLILESGNENYDEINKLKEIIKKIRNKARAIADYDTSDFIRDELTKLGYEIQDKD